nr:unnamed protein product [Callosobruchus chinensis]
MCFTYVTLITSLLVEIIIQLCLLEKTLESVEDNEGIKQCVEWHLQILVFVEKVQRFCGVGISGVLLCGYINICTTLSLLTQVSSQQHIKCISIKTINPSASWSDPQFFKMEHVVYFFKIG